MFKMGLEIFANYFILIMFSSVLGHSITDLELQRKSFGRPMALYRKDMKTLVMQDESGRPFQAILRSGTNFNLWSESSIEDQVTFYLYTRDYNNTVQVHINDHVGLRNTTFNAANPTIILIHGFVNSVNSPSVQLIREAYLSSEEFNVFGVDWSNLAKGPWYVHAAKETYDVGLKVSEFIDYLITNNVSLDSIHMIGHSLGAHVAGIAAKNLKAGTLNRVTGLDPALPLFDEEHVSKRIDAGDAKMVDCIHTCGGLLGFYYPICTHDFYPNGGSLAQPGCFLDIFGGCSHGRAYEYYAESISEVFVADQCTDIIEMNDNRCSGVTGIMGHHSPGTPSGIYYLATNKHYPFAKH